MIRVFTMKAVGKDFLAASWSPYLTEERKKLADRKKGERERQLFLGAEVLLNLSLQQVDARIPIPAKYKRNEHGKPYLEDRQGIYMNWSHSGDYVICAVADREVGIDLQYAGKEPKESLVRKLLQPDELHFYENVPELERQRLFYEYWAVKESFLKALGTGFATPLDRFYVEFRKGSDVSDAVKKNKTPSANKAGSAGKGIITMYITCLDVEGVLVPEIWIAFAEASGIPELKKTTRDEPDYDKLMRWRLGILKEHGLGLKEIQATIEKIDPLPGAREFLDELRTFSQVILISDTFTEFAAPLMKKLGYPTLFCNSLEVADDGEITGFKMRVEQSKLTTVKALQSIGFETIASGDSYNDLGMIQASKAGFLFRSTDKIKADYPQIPAYETYEELLGAIKKAMEK